VETENTDLLSGRQNMSVATATAVFALSRWYFNSTDVKQGT
jgi:hypothetical protein